MKFDFTDRSVVVFGGASGIGRGIAEGFASVGADVTIGDINEDGGQKTAETLQQEHGNEVRFQKTDVSAYESCTSTIDDVVSAFGSVDVVVNAAAPTSENTSTTFEEEMPAEWERHFGVTLKGPIYGTHAGVTRMVEQESGVILNLLSESYKGQDTRRVIYGAMKAALDSFTRSLAKEVGEYDVRVNAISPAATKVGHNEEWIEKHQEAILENYPLKRVGLPEDHAKLAVFLASDHASWITGQTISVNGGYL